MSIDLRKTSHILFFVVCLPALSFGAGWVFSAVFPSLPFWVETLSPLGAYSLLYAFFDKTAWHWPVFRWLGIVVCPDVRGRWVGEQISSFKDDSGKHRKSRVVMEIEQTFSSIRVQTYYYRWRTAHSVAQFIEIQGCQTLIIMFEAEPKPEQDGNAKAHKGVARLTQRPDKKLVGTYFNAAGNHGELVFKRTRYTLHHTFESIGGSNGKSA